MFASRTGATRRILHAYQSMFWLTMYMQVLGDFQDNQLTASAAFAFTHYLLVCALYEPEFRFWTACRVITLTHSQAS